MSPKSPPKLATWLLTRLTRGAWAEALAGDLIEQYAYARGSGWYWRQALMAIAASTLSRLTRLRAAAYSIGRQYRTVALFVLLMLGFRSAWADWVRVPSGSMNPTILEGDRLLVDKHVYGLRVPFTLMHLTAGEDPVRGDIVVFDSPQNGQSLVKRIVGVPGDVISLRDDQLRVNTSRAHYMTQPAEQVRGLLARTQAERPLLTRESGLGHDHDILILPFRLALRSFGPVVVPPDMYFVLGDNRDDSADSRYIGFVPRRDIVGRATQVVMSLDPDRYFLPRSGRWWSPLH